MQTELHVPIFFFAPVILLGLALVLRPDVPVRLQARFYRALANFYQRHGYGDRHLDRLQNPFSRMSIGSLTDYAMIAPDNPAQFPCALVAVRGMGVVLLLLGALPLFLLLMDAVQFGSFLK